MSCPQNKKKCICSPDVQTCHILSTHKAEHCMYLQDAATSQNIMLGQIVESLLSLVLYMQVCVLCARNWPCLGSVCIFASLISVGGRVLFVLAPGLAPLKCWLAAMTQRYSIREGTNWGEQVREKEVFWLSSLPKCATRPRFPLSFLPLCMTVMYKD